MSIGLALALLALPVFGFGLFRLIFPKNPVTRGRALMVMAGAIVLFCIGAIIDGPASSPGVDAKAGAEAGPVIDRPPEVSAEASPSAKADMVALWRRVIEIAQPCDAANTAATEGVGEVGKGRSTVFDAYGFASVALRACEASLREFNELDVPASFPAQPAKDASAAIKTCRETYSLRKQSLEIMMEVLDGDQRPSKVQSYKEMAEAAQSGVFLCVGRLAQIAAELGAELPRN